MRITLNEQERAAVEAHLRSFNKIRAIRAIREATDADLKEAADFLAEFEQQLDPPIVHEVPDMGMTAYVVAVGKYQESLAGYLAYPAHYYAKTQTGAPIVTFLFECFSTSQSLELAACFGIDPWDFNQHKLDPDSLDLVRLHTTFPEGEPQDDEAFFALCEAGFDFYYAPNG